MYRSLTNCINNIYLCKPKLACNDELNTIKYEMIPKLACNDELNTIKYEMIPKLACNDELNTIKYEMINFRIEDT